jgi:hypothetical protein
VKRINLETLTAEVVFILFIYLILPFYFIQPTDPNLPFSAKC